MHWFIQLPAKYLSLKKIVLVITCVFCQHALLSQPVKTRLSNVCAFADTPKNEYALDYHRNLERFIQKMISTIGFSGDYIYISSSPDVDYAASGLRTDGKAEILVADNFNPNQFYWYHATILAHELAHIFNRDIYEPDCASMENELLADYYAGFWASKNNAVIDSVQAPFYRLPDDSTHPPREDRLKAVESGWNHAKKPFTLDVDTVGATSSSIYGKYLNMYFTISPDRRFKETLKYKVYFHLASKDISVPFNSIIQKISRVSYVLHQPTFRHPFVTSCNQNDDSFGYTLTGVYGTFPIVCLVYFKDDSVWSIVKGFPLSEKLSKK
jgi:hypothetical protein